MIETDIWTFRNLQNKNLDGFCFSKNSFIINYATVRAAVPLTAEVIQILNSNDIFRVFYSKFADRISIQHDIEFLMSDDKKSVTFFTKRSDVLYTTIVKLSDNFCLKEGPLEQNISLSHFNNDIDYRKKQSIEISSSDKPDDSVLKIFSTELQLNKLEISYLIGKDGYWINCLRDVTKTTIKIIPILKRLNKKELNSPTNIFQTVIVTGTLTELVQAIVFIESTLTNMI
ncbi:RNA-binding motif protein required for MRE2-dependent mRNA splicing [Maudiozyma exigua]|uniref:RNA-binding motif protein required for MRE2-dependent mRNA splicing n=1 Tax=Maudiozyma exigua TaxID=34358 RepID=A0A9P6WBX0_MAUEX|nr:RNA-binding motif protein required for MRE2-dependent mRNA splicing [Kazachstania exigua]